MNTFWLDCSGNAFVYLMFVIKLAQISSTNHTLLKSNPWRYFWKEGFMAIQSDLTMHTCKEGSEDKKISVMVLTYHNPLLWIQTHCCQHHEISGMLASHTHKAKHVNKHFRKLEHIRIDSFCSKVNQTSWFQACLIRLTFRGQVPLKNAVQSRPFSQCGAIELINQASYPYSSNFSLHKFLETEVQAV